MVAGKRIFQTQSQRVNNVVCNEAVPGENNSSGRNKDGELRPSHTTFQGAA